MTETENVFDPSGVDQDVAAELRWEWEDASLRGLLVGLALGESVHHWTEPVVSAGVGTQLAAFQADGLIRHGVAVDRGGQSELTAQAWSALQRWAAAQGIATLESDALAACVPGHPTGWVAQVPALRERRGSAPATVAALTGQRQQSLGSHAVLRTLPLAPLARETPGRDVLELVVSTARQTHTHSDAMLSAVAAVILAAECGRHYWRDAADRIDRTVADLAIRRTDSANETTLRLAQAYDAARRDPGRPDVVSDLARHRTAPCSLAAAVYAMCSHPQPEDLTSALWLAGQAADGPAAAAIAGGVLGATHGVGALPVDVVVRHELGWVMDTLGRDLLTQLHHRPAGLRETGQPAIPGWLTRYPPQ